MVCILHVYDSIANISVTAFLRKKRAQYVLFFKNLVNNKCAINFDILCSYLNPNKI